VLINWQEAKLMSVKGKIRPMIYIPVLLLIVIMVVLWWLFSNGPYPFLTLSYKPETETILTEYWKTTQTSDAFPPPRVAVVSVFERTDKCSVVSAIIYSRQGSGENAIENPFGVFYKLVKGGEKWTVATQEGGWKADLRQQPNDLTCIS
jgi:hypothetical protein